MRKYFLPYFPRFFRSPDDGGAGADNAGQQGGAGAQGGQSTEQIVAAVLTAVEARQKRAGDSVIKSMAEQYGMTTDEVNALLKAEQDKKRKELPAEVKAQIDAANAKVQKIQLTAEVTKLGAAMGLVDADVAMSLLDSSKISYNDDGAIDGVQSALDALKESKPYLFKIEQKGGWGQGRQGGAPDGGKPGTLKDALNEYYKTK